MPGTTRTFVAIELPPGPREALVTARDRLAAEAPGFRWVEPGSFHLTLAFLGDVADADLAAACRAVAASTASTPPFVLELRGLGAFPEASRPRVIWAGATDPSSSPVLALHRSLVAGLRAAGFPPDDKAFHPHVTLGRSRAGRGQAPDLTRPLGRETDTDFGRVNVSRIVTFGSTPRPEGPEYTPLATAPLRGRKPGGRA